ncbi:MarR family winged helix-turn-helix transcriptional regulator [Novisyntrophococcus fermenticellae]|uniref:MarR family winged helix-turn-helix transcriptional regulator n=1 Tax=Novisyntrophococcus fermenticellae TaxID=2068655 RepID=UPI001E38C2AD|nr:MarR family transcriptional regulator [Novisyntrophococcus fermenticellae]
MNEYDVLKLENQLCFPLYAAAKEVTRLYTPYLNKIGLTYTQYIVMMVVWDEQEVVVKELGRRLYLDTGTLTPLLKKLEKKGLISLSPLPDDRRSVVVKVTEQGMRLREEAKDIPEKVGSCIPLDRQEAQYLYQEMYKILDKIQGQDKNKIRKE